jgi:hypothetical protein
MKLTSSSFGLFFAVLILLTVSLIGKIHADDQNVQGERTEKGYVVSKDNYAAVPSDLRIKKVANNVITPESQEDYTNRKFEELSARLDLQQTQLESQSDQIKDLSARLALLESRR